MKATLSILLSLVMCHSVFGEIRTETVSVRMRDGIKLATDVYRDDTLRWIGEYAQRKWSVESASSDAGATIRFLQS
jgi:predicted acyl esterase